MGTRNKNNQKVRKEKRQKELVDSRKTKAIYPQSANQKEYFDALWKNTINFVVGPPGAGKSFIALYHALIALESGMVDKIVIIRPLAEVRLDEKGLGALPGSAKEKMLPWAGGVMDNLTELLSEFEAKRLVDNNYIEFFPMSLCRGRTFHRCFIIVEEAQNVSSEGEGMKMILTRLGSESRMVIAGDLKQNDLQPGRTSALADAIRKFHNEEGFGVVVLEPEDIVRHPMISTILKKYGEGQSKQITLDEILNNGKGKS